MSLLLMFVNVNIANTNLGFTWCQISMEISGDIAQSLSVYSHLILICLFPGSNIPIWSVIFFGYILYFF